MASKHSVILIFGLTVGVLIGCSNTVDEPGLSVSQSTPNTGVDNMNPIDPAAIIEDSSSTDPIQSLDNASGTPVISSFESGGQFDSSGIAVSNDDLARLLLTDFAVEDQQLVPTTGWICADGTGMSRTYYFYQTGVLDANRGVAIERTLNINDTLSDLTFFWSVAASDAIVMTTVERDDNGLLLSTGRQYDMSTIRFEETDSVQTFTANTVLRGMVICGNYSLR